MKEDHISQIQGSRALTRTTRGKKLAWPTILGGLASNFLFVTLFAQNPPFSSSPEYQAIRAELAQRLVRPSRLSAGVLLREPSPPVPIESKETRESLSLDTPLWQLEIGKNSWEITLTNKRTKLVWKLAPVGRAGASNYWALGPGERRVLKDLPLRLIANIQRHNQSWTMEGVVEGGPQAVPMQLVVLSSSVIRLTIDGSRLPPDAGLGFNFTGAGPFFGLGERFGRVKLDGLDFTLRPEDKLGQPGHNWTYIPVPFLFTPRGLGLYLDTAWPTHFNLTQPNQQRFSALLDGPSADCYFFVGQRPKEILESYTALTGRTPVSPPWAFGVWINSYTGPDVVIEDARRLRQSGIPASAVWVFDVMDPATNMGWPLWRTGFYGNPRLLTDQLHELGFKALTYLYPFVRSLLNPYSLPNPTFQEGTRRGFFTLKPDGQPAGPPIEPYPNANIDFTNPAAVDWWERMVRRILTEHNFDGWMEDFGEWIDDDHRFAVGKTGREMANLYPLLYHRIAYEIARQAKPDVVEFVRSGYAGSQGFTRVVWGGDQSPNWTSDYGLPSVLAAGISVGLSGFAVWGPDIDSNGTSKELWTRWVEFGALTPIMRDHLWDKPKFAVDLWHDAETLDIFRRYARLHVSLFPYFYTYAHEAARTGLPIIRHLMLEWPEDAKTYDAEDEYLLGEKILVAPVIAEGARTRSLYLPGGSWVDYWTGEILEGGRQVTIPAPLERIPILIRAGSVIPLADSGIETLAQELAGGKYRTHDNSSTLRIFPATASSHDTFTLYDGTRLTAELHVGEGSALPPQGSARPWAAEVSVEHSPLVREYEVVLTPRGLPVDVTLSGLRLDPLDDAAYRVRKRGWWVNTADHTLRVIFTAHNFVLGIAPR